MIKIAIKNLKNIIILLVFLIPTWLIVINIFFTNSDITENNFIKRKFINLYPEYVLSVQNCEQTGNSFFTLHEDPQINILPPKYKISSTMIEFVEPVPIDSSVTIYYAKNNENLTEEYSVKKLLPKDSSDVIISLPQDIYTSLRYDIDIFGEWYEIKGIYVSKVVMNSMFFMTLVICICIFILWIISIRSGIMDKFHEKITNKLIAKGINLTVEDTTTAKDKLYTAIKNIKLWIIPPALCFGILVVRLYIKNVDFNLKRFTDRAIGIAILSGIDPAKRQDVYFISIAVFVIAFFLVMFVLLYFDKIISTKKIKLHFNLEKTLLSELSLLLLINTTVAIMNIKNNAKPNTILELIIFVLILHIILKLFALLLTSKCAILPNILKSDFLFFSIISPIPILYLLQLFFGNTNVINIFTPINWWLYVILFLFLWNVIKYLNLSKLVVSFIPFCCIPIMIIFANEMQYTLLKYHSFSPKTIAILLSLILIGIGVLTYFISKNYTKINVGKVIYNVFFPLILITMVGYIYHMQFYVMYSYDLLHSGNSIVPVQQLFEYCKIPFLDYWHPQHLPIGCLLYALFNGFNQFEPMLWNQFFGVGIIVLIGYFSLKAIIPPRWVFLSFLFLPMLQFIDPYYAVAFLPVIYIKTLIKNKKLFDYILFLVLALLSFIYQASAGKISVISSMVILLFSCTSKEDLYKFIKSMIIVFGSVIFIYCGLSLLKGDNIIDKLILVKAFSSVDFNIGSYSRIISENNPLWQVVLAFGFFPLLSLLSVIYVLSRKYKSFREYVILYIASAHLISTIRMLARHSLIEGYKYHFGIILLLIIIFYAKQFSKFSKYALFSTLGLIFLIFIPESNGVKLIDGVKAFEFKRFQQGESRYIANNNALPNNLIKFINNYLEKHQTFFDMINAHLLYTLTGKETPFLHHAVQVIYSEPPQSVYVKQFKKKYSQNKIPIVIFDGPWWGKAIDGIPSELSAYKLSEFIYKNYKPWIVVDGYHLWIANNSDLRYNNDFNYDKNLYNITLNKKVVDYHGYDVFIEKSEDGNLYVQCGNIDPQISNILNENDRILLNKDHEYILSVKAKSTVSGNIQAFYSFDDMIYTEENSSNTTIGYYNEMRYFDLLLPKRNKDVLLTNIRIDPPNGALFKIENIILKDIDNNVNFGYQNKDWIVQEFNLMKLPYIWANYDKKISRNRPETLKYLGKDISVINEVILPFNDDIDKNDGNYIYLKIKSETVQSVKLSYGGTNAFSFVLFPGTEEYVIRVSSQYNWVSQKISELKFEISKPIVIEKISILRGD